MIETPKHRDLLYDKQGGLCYYCKRRMIKRWPHVDGIQPPLHMTTLDHKVPRSKGGTNRSENKCAACHACNGLKGDMTDKEFFKYLRANESQTQSLTLSD
jgi:5-methylcytosine-specific restriction endonuclease McrA